LANTLVEFMANPSVVHCMSFEKEWDLRQRTRLTRCGRE
jgi:hypothetical protein